MTIPWFLRDTDSIPILLMCPVTTIVSLLMFLLMSVIDRTKR